MGREILMVWMCGVADGAYLGKTGWSLGIQERDLHSFIVGDRLWVIVLRIDRRANQH